MDILVSHFSVKRSPFDVRLPELDVLLDLELEASFSSFFGGTMSEHLRRKISRFFGDVPRDQRCRFRSEIRYLRRFSLDHKDFSVVNLSTEMSHKNSMVPLNSVLCHYIVDITMVPL